MALACLSLAWYSLYIWHTAGMLLAWSACTDDAGYWSGRSSWFLARLMRESTDAGLYCFFSSSCMSFRMLLMRLVLSLES